MHGDVVTVERTIAASPEVIFDLLADASKHRIIDGSGTVREVKPGTPERLTLGSTFGMSMKLGVPYSMTNEVVELEENRRIAWQARPRGLMGRLTGGRIWRYELDPVEGGTRVRESWDISRDHQRSVFKRIGLAKKTEDNMTATLDRIADVVAGGTGPAAG